MKKENFNASQFFLVIVIAIGVTALSFAATEIIVRIMDGYALLSLPLKREISSSSSTTDKDFIRAFNYAKRMQLAPGIEDSLFAVTPSRPQVPPPDPVVDVRIKAGLGLPSLYEWNQTYLREFACARPSDFDTAFRPYGEVFVFKPINAGQFPAFRFLREVAYPSGLVTNSFGFRGANLSLDKPYKTVRIAFVGASTTVGAHGSPSSYPEFIGEWISAWARERHPGIRFEVINAGREGINSNSIAEVVRQEVLPLEPDMIVYYEGSNQFWPAAFLSFPGKPPERPRRDPRTAWTSEHYLALAGRIRQLWDSMQRAGEEPPKPEQKVDWPAELDEMDPALDSKLMPLNLPIILKDLETMRLAAEEVGGTFVISSFFWMVSDKLKLHPRENAGVYAYLNETFWPFTYAHMRRMADFQNRVFAKYARINKLEFADFAAHYPPDPALFIDAIHTTPAGTRLQGWVMLQQLLPMIERRLAKGVWPRPDQHSMDKHPAFEQIHLESVESFRRGKCPK